jgi:O-acetyl-ADP-ribose deacetylase (regulator of RNase III)
MIEIVVGDLLEAKEKYIAHQCNCLTQKSAGTAKAIFDKFPHANTYQNRVRGEDGQTTNIDVPGTITILGDGQEQRYVINMFAQYYPGKPKFPLSTSDGAMVRREYFHKCLLRVAKIPELESIAFPWRIGCNLGGGDWAAYLGTITNFAQYVKEKYETRVVIYRREGDE